MHYRRDVDGLRAISITNVMLFHAAPGLLPGGSFGVDIFFVISGYLISSIILGELSAGRFSLLDFYARRCRRILPALAAVLAATWVMGFALLLPADFSSLGVHILSGAAFVSNLTLWSEAGYFDAAAKLKPLLHLWSLGVEEQFYLVWPAVLLLAFRAKRTGPVLACITGASLVLFAFASPRSAFFLPWNRFWELGAGALLALHYRPRGYSPLANARSLVGAGLIGVALALHEEALPWLALPAVAGTVLLLSSPTAWLNRAVLSSPPFVGLGLISYSSYLLHWPLLVFARYALGTELALPVALAIIALSIPLAALTYWFIERPIRYGVRRPRPAFALGVPVLAMAAFGMANVAEAGFPGRFSSELQILTRRYAAGQGAIWRNERCFLSEKQPASDLAPECVDAGDRPLIFLWGDSHAAQLYPGLRAYADTHGFRIAQVTASVCAFIPYIDFAPRPHCRSVNDLALSKIRELKPKLIIVAVRWPLYYYFPDSYWHTAFNVIKQAGPTSRILEIGAFPEWSVPLPAVMLAAVKSGSLPFRLPGVDMRAADEQARRVAEQSAVDYLSPLDSLCNAEGCRTMAGSRQIDVMTFDESHLSLIGSIEYVQDALGPLIPRILQAEVSSR
jgi:peptidoglycan/LPS O-acetylase OafA/YrhL